MFNKVILVISILTLIGCNSPKSAIVRTKESHSQPAASQRNTSKKGAPLAKKESNVAIAASSKTAVTSNLINDYVLHFKAIAMSNMKNFGIPASIILAQGILESGAGQGRLAATANNHFGIKCYTDWKGETTLHDDDSSQECFRKYNNPEESYQDHAAIISKRSRYASLFQLSKGDYKGWAKGLKAAGYATDPLYPEKLINYIERYHLDQYDNMVLGKDFVLDKSQNANTTVINSNKANLYEVQKGDTLYSISKKFNISIETLKKQNNIFDDAISIGQSLKIQ